MSNSMISHCSYGTVSDMEVTHNFPFVGM